MASGLVPTMQIIFIRLSKHITKNEITKILTKSLPTALLIILTPIEENSHLPFIPYIFRAA